MRASLVCREMTDQRSKCNRTAAHAGHASRECAENLNSIELTSAYAAGYFHDVRLCCTQQTFRLQQRDL
jgi:hypothetical protein